MPQKNYSDTEKLSILCAQSAEDKLAENIIILNLTKIDIAPSDMFVICSCDSNTQVRSVSENILKNITEHNLIKPKVEGLEHSEWVILDFFDVVVHVMNKNHREFYNLEKLWADADFYKINDDADLVEVTYKDFKKELEEEYEN